MSVAAPAVSPAIADQPVWPAVASLVKEFDWVPLSSNWVAAARWVPNQGLALRFYQHRHYGPAIFQCIYPGTDMWLYEFFLVAPHPGKLVHHFLWGRPYKPYVG